VDTEVYLVLGQNDGRGKNETGEYEKYPFTSRLQATHLAIFELGPNETQLSIYDKEKMRCSAGPRTSQETSFRVKLKAGKNYVAVCSPRTQVKQTAEFYLSLYLSCELHDIQINRIGSTQERCKLFNVSIVF
jgi:hypothetical protein